MDDDRSRRCSRRGLDAIFDPDAAGVDRRAHRRRARPRRRGRVRCAPRRSTASTLEPDQLRVTRRRDRRRRSSSDDVDAAIDDAIAHLRRVQRAADGARRRLEIRERAGSHRRREGHADQLGRAVRAVGQGQLPERRLPTRRAGDRRRCAAQIVARRAADAGQCAARSTPRCWSCAASSGIADVFRVNGPAGIAALGFGTRVDPAGCARSSGRVRRRSRSPRSRCSGTASPR